MGYDVVVAIDAKPGDTGYLVTMGAQVDTAFALEHELLRKHPVCPRDGPDVVDGGGSAPVVDRVRTRPSWASQLPYPRPAILRPGRAAHGVQGQRAAASTPPTELVPIRPCGADLDARLRGRFVSMITASRVAHTRTSATP